MFDSKNEDSMNNVTPKRLTFGHLEESKEPPTPKNDRLSFSEDSDEVDRKMKEYHTRKNLEPFMNLS